MVAAADPFAEARAFAEEQGTSAYAAFDELLGHADLDAVVICSPTDEHASHVMAAAKAGKHIFCEKPLDLSIDRVRETLGVVEEAGVQLMLGFNRRFDPNFARVREAIANNEIGR